MSDTESKGSSGQESELSQERAPMDDREVVERKVKGTFTWFNIRTGYGFINRSDTKVDVFVHHTAFVRAKSRKDVKFVGDTDELEFDMVVGRKGNEAANLTGIGGVPIRYSPFVWASESRRRRGGYYRRGRGGSRPNAGPGGSGRDPSRSEDGKCDGEEEREEKGDQREQPQRGEGGRGGRRFLNNEVPEERIGVARGGRVPGYRERGAMAKREDKRSVSQSQSQDSVKGTGKQEIIQRDGGNGERGGGSGSHRGSSGRRGRPSREFTRRFYRNGPPARVPNGWAPNRDGFKQEDGDRRQKAKPESNQNPE